MSVLLIDVGNTRVKWARLEGVRLRRQQAAAYAGWQSEDFARHVFGAPRGVERVLIASVVSASVNKMLAAASRQCCGLTPQFIKTSRSAGGVRTMYREPWRLGVDRFVASIGAHRLIADHAVCVVNVGTAMTIDLVDARGVHRGGAIVPGPELMIDSLLNETHGIKRRARSPSAGRVLFARNTRSAIEQGARYAAAAIVDRSVAEAQSRLGVRPRLILTGGAAPSLRPLIQTPARVVPDLVLRGLAALAGE